MSEYDTWLRKLNSAGKGIWGICCPAGSKIDYERLARNSPVGTETILIQTEYDTIRWDECDLGYPELGPLLQRVADKARAEGRSRARLLIKDFDKMDPRRQCALLKSARAFQETQTGVSCQFVFSGRWGICGLRAAYRDLYGNTTSPPVQSKDMFCRSALNSQNILELLQERRLLSGYPSELDLVAARLLTEQTGGDENLVEHVLEELAVQRGEWTDNLEHALRQVMESDAALDTISLRIQSLDESTYLELMKLFQVQRLIRDRDSVEAEKLWLAGLARLLPLSDHKQLVEFAGALTNGLARKAMSNSGRRDIAPPSYLCFERGAIAEAAYRRVAEIENLLRNLLVCHWYVDAGDGWPRKLDEERKLLERARRWQRRQQERHDVELAQDTLMHYLTTGELRHLLQSPQVGLQGTGKPFTTDALAVALEGYLAIRAAVAHNQPLALDTVKRLDLLQRDLANWLTVYADRFLLLGTVRSSEQKSPNSEA